MVAQRTAMRRALAGVHFGPDDKDNVAKVIDHVLNEVQAARLELHMTGFCLQQAEAIRRIDRAKSSLADLRSSRTDLRSSGTLKTK